MTLRVELRCPHSAAPWQAAVRAANGSPGRWTAVCPSCGRGLRLAIVAGSRALQRSAGGHELTGRTFGG